MYKIYIYLHIGTVKIRILSFDAEILQINVSQRSQHLSVSSEQRVKRKSHFAAQAHRQDEE